MIPVSVAVDASRTTGPYRPIWNWFGYDEPNYTETPNGKRLLADLMDLSPEPVRIRTHNLLTSGDGTPALKWGSTGVYAEDAAGRPVYDWTILDRLFDVWVEAGAVPFVQAGFMPEALAASPAPYRHNFRPGDATSAITAGWASPPKDLGKWGDLVEAWARRLVARYGRARVESWPWEIWNEPDGLYWTGSVEAFCALHDAAAAGVRRVLPEARIGGPHTCGAFGRKDAGPFLRAFLDHCSRDPAGVRPLDFIAFHAKGAPTVEDGHVRIGLSRHLRDIEANLAILAEFPALGGLPVVLGESDPEGCAACSSRVYPQNAYRNGPLYGVYVVEHIMRTYELSRRSGVAIDGAVTWAFLFEDQPWFDGFRDLATNGVGKAVLNAFRMLGMLRGAWVAAESTGALALDAVLAGGVRGAPDVNAVATSDAAGLSILLWHYHDDDRPGDAAAVALSVAGLPDGPLSLRHFRMDAGNGNAFAAWRDMGSPQDVDAAALARLQAASALPVIDARAVSPDAGAIKLAFDLPRQGVSLIRLDRGAADGRGA